MKKKLSVIICTFNRGKNLVACLTSLTKQTFSDFEVMVVDGGSMDDTKDVILAFSKRLNIKAIIYEVQELARVRDRGWREAKGELVAWIDDDVVASKDWAKSIVEILDKHPNIAGVSGPTIIKDELLRKRDVFYFYHKKGLLGILGKFWDGLFLEGKKYEVGTLLKSGAWTPGSNFLSSLIIKDLKDVDYLEACNMTLRRDLLEKVGGFDYGYKGVAEWCELDVAMRIKELGYRLVFSPKVMVNHNISQSGVYSRRTQAKQRMENFFKFYSRHIFKLQLDYIFKFSAYVLFLNIYWLYKAIITKNPNWLGGWLGTITGFKIPKIKQKL